MNGSLALPPALTKLRADARTLWRGMAPRERLALAIGGAALLLLLAWLLLVAPAWRTVREAPVQLDVLDVQLQQMQRLAAEAKLLRGAPPVSAAQAVDALRAATERLGARGSIAFQGDRATLTVNGLSGDALRDWLIEARSAAHVRPIDVQLSRTPQGYAGIVVVLLGSAS